MHVNGTLVQTRFELYDNIAHFVTVHDHGQDDA
jgi:hypothetical protein